MNVFLLADFTIYSDATLIEMQKLKTLYSGRVGCQHIKGFKFSHSMYRILWPSAWASPDFANGFLRLNLLLSSTFFRDFDSHRTATYELVERKTKVVELYSVRGERRRNSVLPRSAFVSSLNVSHIDFVCTRADFLFYFLFILLN